MSRLTIAIPAYNRPTYLMLAIESALKQSLPVNVLVVNNASSDARISDLCRSYAGRVEYFEHSENIGMFNNWNFCVDAVKTEYVMILGDDDLLDPSFSSVFEEVVLETDCDVYIANFRYLDAEGEASWSSDFKHPWGLKSATDARMHASAVGLGLPTISMAFRKGAIPRFFGGFTASNDWLSVYSCPPDVMFFFDRRELVFYRKHSYSDSVENNYRNIPSQAAIFASMATRLEVEGKPLLSRIARMRSEKNYLWLIFHTNEEQLSKILKYYESATDSPYQEFIEKIRQKVAAKPKISIWLRYAILSIILKTFGRMYEKYQET